MTTELPTEFDSYRDTYGEAVQKSIAFSGAELEFFTRAKARVLLDLVTARVGEPGSLSFLDVGCGPGETGEALAGRVGALTGVDVSSVLLERARERNPWARYHAYAAGDPIPAESASFDISFAICVFHHVDVAARPSLLREMLRVTKPGGLIALFEHNPLNPLTRRAVASCEFDRDAVLLGRRHSSHLLQDAGLVDVDGSYIVFFTRKSQRLQAIERRLRRLPLGAQYVVAGKRP